MTPLIFILHQVGLLSAHETSGSSFILQVWAMCQSEWQGDGLLISWKLGLFWADEFSRAALSNQVIARKKKDVLSLWKGTISKGK